MQGGKFRAKKGKKDGQLKKCQDKIERKKKKTRIRGEQREKRGNPGRCHAGGKRRKKRKSVKQSSKSQKKLGRGHGEAN